LGRCDYQYNHEPILVGWKPTAGHNWYADRKQRTTWNFDRPTKSKHHPTMKPVALCAYPIMNSSLTNNIVLDSFGGSGSTLIACEQTGRICYTIELDERYADVIVKRYIEQKGSDTDVFLMRDTQKTAYIDVKKSVE
jgi:ParB family chromosome partitioning protein